eukprot:3216190-Rhodomonas_salina.1
MLLVLAAASTRSWKISLRLAGPRAASPSGGPRAAPFSTGAPSRNDTLLLGVISERLSRAG